MTNARTKYNKVNCPICGRDLVITEAQHDKDICPICRTSGVLEDIELDIDATDEIITEAN